MNKPLPELIGGPVVSFLGLLTFFGTDLYVMHQYFSNYGPETTDEWAAYVGGCLFLLGGLVFLIVAPLRAGTRQLMMGPAISFLGLLTFFGALLYVLQVLINEHGYPQTAQGWAYYVGVCIFLFGGLILTVNVLWQLARQTGKGEQAASTEPPS